MFSFGEGITAKDVYDSLDLQEKERIDKFKDYLLITASQKRIEEATREILRFRVVVGKNLYDISLDDLRYFLKELKLYDFADYTKNKIKDWIKRFLRWAYRDWSERFDGFYDIKTNTDAQNRKPITSESMILPEEIKKLLDAEPTLYWKTFLMVQYEGALRTGEARTLTWDRVVFDDDGFTTLNIPSKKNRNATIKVNSVVVGIAGNFLKELRKQQDKYEIKSKYVFPSPQDVNRPISKAVNLWFNHLCKKVLGREANNYLLRHSRGTELQQKVRNGELSKDNAVEFMRHSGKMFDKVYSHMDKEDIKQLMKKQIYNTKSLTREEKGEVKRLKEISRTFAEALKLFLEEKINNKKISTQELVRIAEKIESIETQNDYKI